MMDVCRLVHVRHALRCRLCVHSCEFLGGYRQINRGGEESRAGRVGGGVGGGGSRGSGGGVGGEEGLGGGCGGGIVRESKAGIIRPNGSQMAGCQ